LIPQDIGPARWTNTILGACLFLMGGFVGFPVVTAIYYDGIESVLDWPSVFNWMSVISAGLLVPAGYLLFTPQRVGGDIRFAEGGFTVQLRRFLRRDAVHDVRWSDIETVEAVDGARGTGGFTLRQRDGTRVSFEIRLFELGVEEMLVRLRQSAEAAGYRFKRVGGFHAGIIAKQTWAVV